MIYLSKSDGCRYEVKTDKVKGITQTFIRCLDGKVKGTEWSTTTEKHIENLINLQLFTPQQ